MMTKKELQKLEPYLPQNAASFVENWLKNENILFRITKTRKTKLGDYRKLQNISQISINGDLSAEPFFFVLTHEIAHHFAFKNSRKRILPHGKEWKQNFRKLLEDSLHIYKLENQSVILNHAKNPKANLLADRNLTLTLFSRKKEGVFYLDDLLDGEKFKIGNRTFIKIKKRKIRYICREIATKRLYSISGLAVVEKEVAANI